MSNLWQGKVALVTGAQGFLGGWVASLLNSRGAKVIGYDRARRGCLELHSDWENIKTEIGELIDGERFRSVMHNYKPEFVFHIAAQAEIGIAKKDPVSTYEGNIKGTWTVLEACREAGDVSVIATSSNTVYGGKQKIMPTPEDSPISPDEGPYAVSKACTDLLTRCYADTYGMKTAVIRPTNSYGGADWNTRHLVIDMVLSILRNESPVLLSDGQSVKGFQYAEDTAGGYLTLAENIHRPEVVGQAFNIVPDDAVSVKDLVEKLVSVSENPDLPVIIKGTKRPASEIDREFLSNQKAKKILGWKPRYTLAQGLKETLDWYAKHDLEKLAERTVEHRKVWK